MRVLSRGLSADGMKVRQGMYMVPEEFESPTNPAHMTVIMDGMPESPYEVSWGERGGDGRVGVRECSLRAGACNRSELVRFIMEGRHETLKRPRFPGCQGRLSVFFHSPFEGRCLLPPQTCQK